MFDNKEKSYSNCSQIQQSKRNAKSYTGYEKDAESGLDFAQARYYNSSHGRFTSIDPLTASATIRNPQTFNRYSYVLNSPYKFVDPLGLITSSTGACGSWCPNTANITRVDAYADDDDENDYSGPLAVSPPPPPPSVGEFVQTGKVKKFVYGTKPLGSRDGGQEEIGGEKVFVEYSWDAAKGYVLAEDGKTKITAYEKRGELQYKIVNSEGKEFNGKKDAAAAAELLNEVKAEGTRRGLDNTANCHGTTFAGGKVWINKITKKTLKAMGYRQVVGDEPVQMNDVALYKDKGNYDHSATFNKDLSTVRGKGGIEAYKPSVPYGPGPGTAWEKGKLEVWTKRPTK